MQQLSSSRGEKIHKTLNEIQNYFGDIEIVITREMTKVFEEVITNKISNILSEINEKPIKGEMVILFNTSELIQIMLILLK
ncbi:MAG: hypothetical protein CM15mP111_2350 [Hyphomicrobiales bacterium]|nr:MAG: hypothetical protein CM15mP111_2350 [Hyphomicrobiales bacterium]